VSALAHERAKALCVILIGIITQSLEQIASTLGIGVPCGLRCSTVVQKPLPKRFDERMLRLLPFGLPRFENTDLAEMSDKQLRSASNSLSRSAV
jgi:hypothetical protein